MSWSRREDLRPAPAARPCIPLATLLLAVLGAVTLGPRPVGAQEADLAGFCASDPLFEQPCLAAAQHLLSTAPRLALAAAGGNSVPGTGSTLGMRLGRMPRWTVALRGTGVLGGDVPVLSRPGEEEGFNLAAAGVHGGIGVFDGFSLAPTVGGVLSVDALGAVTLVRLSRGTGFESATELALGGGIRLGILRESFTLPGVSVTGTYHRLGSAGASGQETLGGPWGEWQGDLARLGVRAAASKSLFGFGLTAGTGLDRVSFDGRLGGQGIDDIDRTRPVDTTDTRLLLFGGASYTLLVLHLVAEAGWQEGGDGVPGAAASRGATDAAWYATLALRLSI